MQLRSRHWKITDALGRLQEVKGPGVVGKTPMLRPGEVFEYTSGTPLSTPWGFMGGTYQMVSESGRELRHRDPDLFTRPARPDRKLN